MAIGTFSNPKRIRLGNRWQVSATYTPAASTGATGDALTAAALKQLGLGALDQLIMGPLVNEDGSAAAHIGWRRGTDGLGKIHIYEGVSPHLHTFIVKAGTAAAGTDTMNIKGATGSAVIGKEEATEKINPGGATAGGVQAAAAGATTLGRQSGGDFSAYQSAVVAVGRGV